VWRWNVFDLVQDRVKVTEVRSEVLSSLRGERGEDPLNVIFLCHSKPRIISTTSINRSRALRKARGAGALLVRRVMEECFTPPRF